MTYTEEQIIKRSREVIHTFSNEFNKKLNEGKNRIDGTTKAKKYINSFTKKHAVEFGMAIVLESVKLSIEEFEPDKEKAKEIFLEWKLSALSDYKEPEPETEFVRKIVKLTSAKKIKDIKNSLEELNIPQNEWHKRQLLNLLKTLKEDGRKIRDVFKNNDGEQYSASVLSLATYVEVLLKSALAYKFGKSKYVKINSQSKRIEKAKELGLIDDKLHDRLKRFNTNRNEYIHISHIKKRIILPINLYEDGRIIIEQLTEIIVENLPRYITEKKCSADELIEKLEKEFKDQEKKLIKKMNEELNTKKTR